MIYILKNIYLNILDTKQLESLKILKLFRRKYYLAGGTAIALQLGHRKSIDFDMFSYTPINRNNITKNLKDYDISAVTINEPEQLTLVVNSINLTFLEYPFKIEKEYYSQLGIYIPDVITLGAMKAYTLGRRAKWKDYVDIYFISKEYGINRIIEKAKEIYKGLFNEKIFKEQLSYFKDIDYTEKVDYIEKEFNDANIQKYLKEISISE